MFKIVALVPTTVGIGTSIHNAHFIECGMYIGYLFWIDSVIRTQWSIHGIQPPVILRFFRRSGHIDAGFP